MENKEAKKKQILNALKEGKRLTSLDGFVLFGTVKLTTRISELRAEKHDIKSCWESNNNSRYKVYYLEKEL